MGVRGKAKGKTLVLMPWLTACWAGLVSSCIFQAASSDSYSFFWFPGADSCSLLQEVNSISFLLVLARDPTCILMGLSWVHQPLSHEGNSRGSFFLRLHLWHLEIPRPRVKLELQLLAYATVTAMPDLRCLCNLCDSLQQYQIFNPLSEARDRTHILGDTVLDS